MSTTTPTAVKQICGKIETISTTQFADAVTHYEMDCGLTADTITDMTPNQLTLRTTFSITPDSDNTEEATPTRIALGWHLFSHPDFLAGDGWTKHDDITICPVCVIPTDEETCSECNTDTRHEPSFPDTILMQETVEIEKTIESVADVENALENIFHTPISIN